MGAADLAQAGIPLLDVTTQLRGVDHEELWVTPADTHPNTTAQSLVIKSITDFVRDQTGW